MHITGAHGSQDGASDTLEVALSLGVKPACFGRASWLLTVYRHHMFLYYLSILLHNLYTSIYSIEFLATSPNNKIYDAN